MWQPCNVATCRVRTLLAAAVRTKARFSRAEHTVLRVSVTPPLQSSELLAANTKAVDEACQPVGEAPSVSGGTYAATYKVQLQQLLGRQMTRYWRMPQVGLDPPKLEWVEGWVGGELTAAGVHSGCHGLQPVARELSGFLTWKLAMPRQHTMRHSNAPQYNGIRFVVSLAFALVVGSLYYKKGQVGVDRVVDESGA